MTDMIDALFDAIDHAEAEALAAHNAGTCGESEWSCSYCERGLVGQLACGPACYGVGH